MDLLSHTRLSWVCLDVLGGGTSNGTRKLGVLRHRTAVGLDSAECMTRLSRSTTHALPPLMKMMMSEEQKPTASSLCLAVAARRR